MPKRLFWLALALFLVTQALQLWSDPSPTIVRLELAFTEACATKVVTSWGDAGTSQAKLNLKLDFLFIFFGYVPLFLASIRWAMRPVWAWLYAHGPRLQRAVLIAGGCDVVENVLLLSYLGPGEAFSALYLALAGVAAAAKFLLLILVIVVFWVWMLKNKPVKGWLLDLQSILKLCRANVIVLLVGWVFLLLVPQGRDVVHTLGEPLLREKWIPILLFFVAVGLWAWNVWYWARVMLRFKWKREPSAGKGRSGWAAKLREHVPRVLGVLAVVAVAAAFASAASASADSGTKAGHQRLFWITCALGLLFYAFVFFRRRWAATKKPGPPPPPPLPSYSDNLTALGQLGRKTLLALAILAGITVALFATFSFDPGRAVWLGSAAVVLFAAAAWVPFGALLVYAAQRYEIPLLTLLAAGLVVFSYLNDNHPVRKIGMGEELTSIPGVEEHFRGWLAQRPIGDASTDSPYPVVIVAAEGGGIRAAYWTATVLGRLQDEWNAAGGGDRFSDHVYAISGVSGGSLGAAVFAALVREQRDGNDLACATAEDGHSRGPFELCAHQLLREDFLSPTAAALLYPDLVQRFLFFPVNHFSRGRALETAWEDAWNDQSLTRGRFGAEDGFSFRDLWRDDERSTGNLFRVPLLFLNTTHVETGKRALFSPLPVGKPEFQDTTDLHATMGQEVRLSTAAHASARFTFVSPAGTVRDKHDKVWGHVVDGGYFENSGATTALEILQAMRTGAAPPESPATDSSGTPQEDLWPKIRPIVVMITNDPGIGTEPQPRRFLKEALSPIVALLQTRGARGRYSKEALKAAVQEDCASCPIPDAGSTTVEETTAAGITPRCADCSVCRGFFLEVHLKRVEGVPLGWALSKKAIKKMNEAIGTKTEPVLTCLGKRPS